LDRKCRCSSKNKNYKKDDDHDVRTFQLMQTDLNQVYTNQSIEAHYVFSTVFVFYLTVLCYSAGMPVLYPMACLFFTLVYWIYKCLLLKFYSKATQFDENLARHCTFYLKFGLILHGVFTFFILNSQDILVSSAERKEPLVVKSYLDGSIFNWFYGNFLYR
jgi:hypothetical protein